MNDIKYFDKTIELVKKIKATQSENIYKASVIMAESIKNGGLVHLFGSGHSVLPIQDVFPRYGGHVGFHSRLMWSDVIGVGGATSTIAAICVSQAFASETALRLQEMGEQLHIFVSPNVVEVPQTLLMTSQNIKLPSSIGGGENLNIQTNEGDKSPSEVVNNSIEDDDLKSQQGLDKEGYKEFLKQIFADSFVDGIDRLQG